MPAYRSSRRLPVGVVRISVPRGMLEPAAEVAAPQVATGFADEYVGPVAGVEQRLVRLGEEGRELDPAFAGWRLGPSASNSPEVTRMPWHGLAGASVPAPRRSRR